MTSKLAISTFSFLWLQPVHACLERLSDVGYRSFEIPLSHPHCWPTGGDQALRRDVLRLIQSRDLNVVGLNRGGFDINLASPAPEVRAASVGMVEAAIALAEDWGGGYVVISPGVGRPVITPPLEKLHEWLRESLERLVESARRKNVRLLMENAPYSFLSRIEDLLALVDWAEDPSLGIVYDVANAQHINEDPTRGFRLAQEHIYSMHLSDTGTEAWGHDPIGTGDVDWASLARSVGESAYKGPLVLEVIRQKDTEMVFAESIAALDSYGWEF